MARPWVTWGYALVCVLYAWQVTGFFPTEETLLPSAWSREAWQAGEWHRLLRSVVAHGGLLHLVFNLISLVGLGAGLEPRLGPARTAAVLAVAGLGGNLAHALASDVPVVGASGAIFGLLGTLLVLVPAAPITVFVVQLPVVVAAAFYAALVMLVPAFSAAAPVAHVAHLGGLGAGVALGAAYAPRKAARHAPWVGAVFVLAFVAVLWFRGHDLAEVPRLWNDQGWLAVLGYLALPLACLLGILLALGALERHAEQEDD